MTVTGWGGRSALRTYLTLSLALCSISLPGLVNVPADAARINSKKVKSDAPDLTARLNELTVALAAADAARLAAMWSENGTYTNEDGQQWKGRTAISKRFADVFNSQGRLLLDFIPTSSQNLADNVVIAEGFVKLKGTPAGELETRYAIVFQKQTDGSWLIVSASETPYVANKVVVSRLKSLDWLAGDWQVQTDKDGSTMHIKAEWAADNKFLHLRYLSSKPGQAEVLESHQIIGFDPRIDQVVSWSFDASGGFGSAAWLKRDNKWYVDASGVGADGRATRATNIVSVSSPDSFTWQSINRMVDGQALNDTAILKLQRAGKN